MFLCGVSAFSSLVICLFAHISCLPDGLFSRLRVKKEVVDLTTPVALGVGRSAAAEGVVCQSHRNILRFLLQEFYPLLSQDATELHCAGTKKTSTTRAGISRTFVISVRCRRLLTITFWLCVYWLKLFRLLSIWNPKLNSICCLLVTFFF